MKIVLRHRSTGRYYQRPKRWVRRADNALLFDDVTSAEAFSRAHRLGAQPVHRLAPFMMELLRLPPKPFRNPWAGRLPFAAWCAARLHRFSEN